MCYNGGGKQILKGNVFFMIHRLRLINITKKNWEAVLELTTNENEAHTLDERFIYSNAWSMVQAEYENGWTIKAIQEDQTIIGFTMYGWCESRKLYELCSFMIDSRYQNRGYGAEALELILREMERKYACREVYLSTAHDNVRAKHLYEEFGFRPTGDTWDGEDVYCCQLSVLSLPQKQETRPVAARGAV